jgi:hypothetical protein
MKLALAWGIVIYSRKRKGCMAVETVSCLTKMESGCYCICYDVTRQLIIYSHSIDFSII